MSGATPPVRLQAKRLGIKKKEPKDPGIPAAWPFKEELIAQLKAQKERADAKQRAITAQRRAEKVLAGGARGLRTGVGSSGRGPASGEAGGSPPRIWQPFACPPHRGTAAVTPHRPAPLARRPTCRPR